MVVFWHRGQSFFCKNFVISQDMRFYKFLPLWCKLGLVKVSTSIEQSIDFLILAEIKPKCMSTYYLCGADLIQYIYNHKERASCISETEWLKTWAMCLFCSTNSSFREQSLRLISQIHFEMRYVQTNVHDACYYL